MKPRNKYYSYLVAVILVLLFPALFINLGLLPLIADEATRALVALEMEISENIITPTINGEYYFNKPPLYNWVLLSLFKISKQHSEYIIRLPAVVSLLIFGLLLFLTIRKKTGDRTAFLSAMAFITCGRILFYDSMLGLIDLSFSLLIFLNFILIYHYGKTGRFSILFLLSYLIAGITFLMKGLPAIVFQGTTLLMAMIYFKQWKNLLTYRHLIGIAVFLLITGSYYYLVLIHNPESQYFEVLVSESTKRTFIRHGFLKTILHLFTYPAEQIYHLLPWSLLFVYMIRKPFYREIREHDFLAYLALVFLVNIPVYWISVDSYPRYVFMLYPILFILIIHHYIRNENSAFTKKIFFPLLMTFLISGLVAGAYLFLKHDFYDPSFSFAVFIPVFLITAFILFLIWKNHGIRLELLVIMLLVIRIGFNLVILPERLENSRTVIQRQQAKNVAKIAEGRELRLRPWTGISHETSFYISRETKKILRVQQGTPFQDILYIVSGNERERKKETLLYRFETRWKNNPLHLVIYPDQNEKADELPEATD